MVGAPEPAGTWIDCCPSPGSAESVGGSRLGLGLTEPELEPELGVADPLADGVAEPEPEAEAPPVAEGVAVAFAEPEGDAELEPEGDEVPEGEAVTDSTSSGVSPRAMAGPAGA